MSLIHVLGGNTRVGRLGALPVVGPPRVALVGVVRLESGLGEVVPPPGVVLDHLRVLSSGTSANTSFARSRLLGQNESECG